MEKAKFANLFRGDAAGGEVGDGAGAELEANVGDIRLWREHGETDRTDFGDLGISHGEDDVEIVDHEVKDDVDVEGARGKDGQPVCLKEHGPGEARQGGSNGGVEALEVAGGEDAAAAGGEGNQRVGFVEVRGEGFFDEDVEAGFKELCGDRGVSHGGDGNGDSPGGRGWPRGDPLRWQRRGGCSGRRLRRG